MSEDHITLPRSVVEQAIQDMEKARAHFGFKRLGESRLEDSTCRANLADSTSALRAALAAPQAEPVAWQRRDKWVESGEWDFWRDDFDPDEELDPEWAERRPLYAARSHRVRRPATSWCRWCRPRK